MLFELPVFSQTVTRLAFGQAFISITLKWNYQYFTDVGHCEVLKRKNLSVALTIQSGVGERDVFI